MTPSHARGWLLLLASCGWTALASAQQEDLPPVVNGEPGPAAESLQPQPEVAPAAPATEPELAARSAPPVVPTSEPPHAAPPAEQPREQGKQKKQKAKLDAKGRLFLLAELSRQELSRVSSTGMLQKRPVTTLDLSVQSARVGLEYRGKPRWLRAEIEVELSGKVHLEDAYLEAKQHYWEVQAGQFKVPFSALMLDSSWTLPTVTRGFVHDVLTDRLDVAGRRPGLGATARAHGALDPRLTLAAFQGSQLSALSTSDRDTDLIERQGVNSQSFAARGEIRPGDFEIGASYEHRLGAVALDKTRHFWTAGADVKWSLDHAAGGLRLWLDLMAGASWYEHASKAADGDDATFTTVRLLVAHRFGGLAKGDFYVEPFAFGALFDPDADVISDQAWEGMLGVAGGLWHRARVTLQGEFVSVRRNFPASYAMGDADRLALLLQAGAVF